MPLLPRVRSLWNTLMHKDRLDRELDDELRAAVDTLASRDAAGGLAPHAARRAAVRALRPESLSWLEAARVDPAVLAFTLGISAVWGLLLSLAPLTELFKADPGRSLQRHSRTTTAPVRYRTRAVLAPPYC